MAKNIKMEVKDGKLMIEVDLAQNFGPSGSGKNIIIASSEGATSVPGEEGLKLNLTAYKKPEAQ